MSSSTQDAAILRQYQRRSIDGSHILQTIMFSMPMVTSRICSWLAQEFCDRPGLQIQVDLE